MTVAVDAFGRHGATHDLALRGSWSEWPGECHGKVRVSSEYCWSTRMDAEAVDSVVWLKCATSTDCIQSIDSHVLGYGHNSGVSHTMYQHL